LSFAARGRTLRFERGDQLIAELLICCDVFEPSWRWCRRLELCCIHLCVHGECCGIGRLLFGRRLQHEFGDDIHRSREGLPCQRQQRLLARVPWIVECIAYARDEWTQIRRDAGAQCVHFARRQRPHVPGELGRAIAPVRKNGRDVSELLAVDRRAFEESSEELRGRLSAHLVAGILDPVVDAVDENHSHGCNPSLWACIAPLVGRVYGLLLRTRYCRDFFQRVESSIPFRVGSASAKDRLTQQQLPTKRTDSRLPYLSINEFVRDGGARECAYDSLHSLSCVR
jgi:hypothetical protein